jgi:hypothetical protein
MKAALIASVAMLIAALGGAAAEQADESATPSASKLATPEALKAEIETLRVAKVAWRKVEWRTCLVGALNEAARERKPVFLWVLGGAPADGRC